MALFDDMLPEVRPGLSQLPDVSLVAALRRASQRLCRESQIWADDLDPFVLVAGRGTYPVQAPDGARVERTLVVKVNGQAITMQMRARELRALQSTDGQPCAWAVFESQDGLVIAFDRTPQLAEAGQPVAMHAALSPSDDADEIPDWLSTDHHEAIVSAARAEVLGQRGTPHYDRDAAADERFRASMGIAQAKRSQISGKHALLRAMPRRWV